MTERMADEDARIQLAEERLNVDVQKVETGRVRVKTSVDTREVWVRGELERQAVQVERVAIDRMVEQPPQIRQDGDMLIVPVVEEVIVVEKRFLLKEELHIRTIRSTQSVEEPVTLRTLRADVERSAV